MEPRAYVLLGTLLVIVIFVLTVTITILWVGYHA